MVQYCKGHMTGPWVLNAFIIWNNLKVSIHVTVSSFIDPFLDVFAPESSVSESDTCVLLRLLNSMIPGPHDDYYITVQIVEKYFKKRLSFTREVFCECPSEIPNSKKTDSSLFPLEFRL